MTNACAKKLNASVRDFPAESSSQLSCYTLKRHLVSVHFAKMARKTHAEKYGLLSQCRIIRFSWWLLGFYDSTRDKDDTTVGVGHSRRYCNTGYDQSQGRRPSTFKCIGPISKGDIEPNHPSEINPNSDSRSRSDGRSRRFVQYRVDQSQGQRPRSLLPPPESS